MEESKLAKLSHKQIKSKSFRATKSSTLKIYNSDRNIEKLGDNRDVN